MKNISKKKIITLCSSASFYKEVLDIEKELKRIGFIVKVPSTAREMHKKKDFRVENYKTWFQNENEYHVKAKKMRDHFKKVEECDAILIVNLEKNGMKGYIGANVLMEMALAFHLKKKIFLYDSIDEQSPSLEEIKGMMPVILNRNMKQLKTFL